jgi:2-oxo-4-hydroxy-4-carboxy--5-ureidoimidazoline (OHCU) decarboxylase
MVSICSFKVVCFVPFFSYISDIYHHQMVTAAELGTYSKEKFVEVIGGIYEHSPWVVERAHALGPFNSLTSMHKAMCQVLADASDEEKLSLLNAHPDLAGKAAAANELTAESTTEQVRY